MSETNMNHERENEALSTRLLKNRTVLLFGNLESLRSNRVQSVL